ncbi:MAG: VOC family protein [Saprospiraceae bacterium]
MNFNHFLITASFLLIQSHTFSQIPITGYNHVALSVKDLDVSAAYYRDIIGLTQLRVPEDMTLIRAWFAIGPGQELHLLAGRKDDVCQSVNDKNGSHFSLTIPDANPVEDYFKSKNITYHRQQRFDGVWQIYITDPDGYVIELNEPKK